MTDDSKILSLPLEILTEIRSYLNYSSMCSLVLVSKGWKEVWENPYLWSEFTLEHYYFRPKDKNDLESILKTRRFSELKSVRIRILDEDTLTVISKQTNIRNVEIENIEDNIEKDKFAKVLSKLESISLYGKDDDNDDEHGSETEWLTALFEKIVDDDGEPSKIKKLALHCNLASINCRLMVKCFNQLEELILYGPSLTSDQTFFFFMCTAVQTNLRKLELHEWDFSHVEPELIALVFSTMDKVVLGDGIDIQDEQIEALLDKLNDDSKLKCMEVSVDLSGVDPDILARGVNQLEKVSIRYTELTEIQIEKILSHALKSSKLKYLDISDNRYVELIANLYPNMLADVKRKVPVVIDTVDPVYFFNEEPVSDESVESNEDSDGTVEWNDDADDSDEISNDFVQQ